MQLFLLIPMFVVVSGDTISQQICNYVNNFRQEIGKGIIPHSRVMEYVSSIHYENLIQANHDVFNQTCNLHSWYHNDTLGLVDCCYPKMTTCMARMPQFLTRDWQAPYQGNAVENAHASLGSGFFGGSTPFSVVESWKNSPPHRFQMERDGWKACGGIIGSTYQGRYITSIGLLWLGDGEDNAIRGDETQAPSPTPLPPTPVPTPLPTLSPTPGSTPSPTPLPTPVPTKSPTPLPIPASTQSPIPYPTTTTQVTYTSSIMDTSVITTIDTTNVADVVNTTTLPTPTVVNSTIAVVEENKSMVITFGVLMGLFFLGMLIAVYLACRYSNISMICPRSRNGRLLEDYLFGGESFDNDDNDVEMGEVLPTRKQARKIHKKIDKSMKNLER